MPAALKTFYSVKRHGIRTDQVKLATLSEPCELAHDPVESGLTLKADARAVRQRDHAALDAGIVRKAAEVAEYARIRFRAAEAEASGNRKRHLVAAMRKHRAAGPSVTRQHIQRLGVLADAVSLRRIDLDDVAAVAKAAEAHQVFHILRRIEVFSGRKWRLVIFCELGEQREIKRVAWFLEPPQLERRERPGVAQGFGAIELAIGINSEALARSDDLEHGLKPTDVLVERQAADFHLHHRVAGAKVTAHFLLQVLDGLPGPVPAATDVTKHLVGNFAAIESLGEQHAQRLVGNLGNGIPDRNLDRADRDRPFGMPSGLFPPHHAGEDFP